MARIASFILVRLLALAWIMILANIFEILGPYSISILILVSEALFGYLWAKAETEVTMCKPKREDPKLLVYLMLGTAAVESVLAWYIVGSYAVWIIVWRAMTGYFPFSIMEIVSYERMCKMKKV